MCGRVKSPPITYRWSSNWPCKRRKTPASVTSVIEMPEGDLISGQVKFYFSNAAASIGHVQSGTLKCLAHTGRGRLALDRLPDLPVEGGDILAVPAPIPERLSTLVR